MTELFYIVFSILLIIHSIKYFGTGFTKVFWIGAFITAGLHALLVARVTGVYIYGKTTLSLFSVPFVIPVCWTLGIYISRLISEKAGGKSLLAEKVSSRFFLAGLIFSGLICFIVLIPLTQNGIFRPSQGDNFLLIGVPVVVFFDYGLLGLLYFLSFRVVYAGNWPESKRIVGLMILSPLILLIHQIVFLTARYLVSLLIK